MLKLRQKTSIPLRAAEHRCGVLSDNCNIYGYLNIIRVSSEVPLTKAQSNMMIPSLELVLSVKGKITCLSVGPSGPAGFWFTAPTKRGKDQKRKGVRDFTDGGIELEEWERRQVMGKGFGEHGTETGSWLCRENFTDNSSFLTLWFSFYHSRCDFYYNIKKKSP